MAGEIYLSNLSGQFDYQAIIDKFQSLKATQISALQQKEDLIYQKKSAYKSFKEMVESFDKSLENLLDDSIFLQKNMDISNENILSATINDPSKLSKTSLEVISKQLAKNDVWLSQKGVNDKDSGGVATSDGTLQIKYAGSEVATIDYTASDTLQNIADKINSSQDSVTASIFFDGTEYRLLLTGKDTGEDNTVELNETGSGDLLDQLEIGNSYSNSHVQTAQNAQIEIYGEIVESSSNSFDNVIEGLTLEIKDVSSESVELVINEDNEPIRNGLQDLISNYNSIIDFIKEYTQKGAPLSGDFSLHQIRSSIFKNLTPLFEEEILNVDHTNGHLSINSSKLDNLLSTNKDELKSKIDELESGLEVYMDYALDIYGPIRTKEKSFDRQIDNIEKRIESTSKRVEAEIENLKKQFVYLDRFLAQMNDIRNRLSALLPKNEQNQ